MGTIETTPKYWDCECPDHMEYIHSAIEDHCPNCGAEREDQPESRVKEVNEMLARHEMIKKIAKEVLRIATLEVQNSDSLDFHDCGVISIKEALDKAYREGHKAGYKAGYEAKHSCLLYVNPERDCQALRRHEEQLHRTK